MAKKAKKFNITLVSGDCIVAMRDMKTKADLIIADPPYNMNMKYNAYKDKLTKPQYLEFTIAWVDAAVSVLQSNGSMWVFAPDEWVSEVDTICKQRGLNKRNHVVWVFTFGQSLQKKFSRSHCHILYYTRHKAKFTFNADGLRVPSARSLVYKDKRANPEGKLPDDTWMLLREQLEPYMTPDTDTWLESRICGTFKERKKYVPNQIPVQLMERIISACSNEKDLVLDPFCGTASSAAAAIKLHRNYIGVDIDDICINEAIERLELPK